MPKEIKHTTDHSPEKIGTREDGTEYKYINMPPMVSTLFRFAEDCVLKSSIKDEDEGKDFIIEMLSKEKNLHVGWKRSFVKTVEMKMILLFIIAWLMKTSVFLIAMKEFQPVYVNEIQMRFYKLKRRCL